MAKRMRFSKKQAKCIDKRIVRQDQQRELNQYLVRLCRLTVERYEVWSYDGSSIWIGKRSLLQWSIVSVPVI